MGLGLRAGLGLGVEGWCVVRAHSIGVVSHESVSAVGSWTWYHGSAHRTRARARARARGRARGRGRGRLALTLISARRAVAWRSRGDRVEIAWRLRGDRKEIAWRLRRTGAAAERAAAERAPCWR